MAWNRTAVLIVGTLAAGHLSYHVLKPLIIPETANTKIESVPEKPVYWEKQMTVERSSSGSTSSQ